jgi:GT2 family glycosyltransferase
MKKISFLINTSVNTLDHVKLLLRSLKENLSSDEHEILIFVDSDNEGTVDYLREQKKNFKDLRIITHNLKPCVGYSRNNNLLVELAKNDIVSYLQSDMVISKNYDVNILSELEDNCILSSTRIEPPLHGASETTITRDFGVDPQDFKWDEFVQYADTVKSNKTLEYFFAPITFYKKVWLDIGGYDTLFRRSREDSDLVQRCVQAGIKLKQTFAANVYHFSCVSSRGKNWFDQNNLAAQARVNLQNFADQIELKRFIRKWGRFNHGEEKLRKLDMDLVLVDDSSDRLSMIARLEPYFSKVWLNTEEEKERILGFYKREHNAANDLLKFSDEDWEVASKFYNQTNYDEVYQVGEPQDFNMKVTVRIERENSQITKDTEFFLNNINFLAEIIQDPEPGIYEVGVATLEVRRVINLADSHIKCENPPFDYSLLSIE